MSDEQDEWRYELEPVSPDDPIAHGLRWRQEGDEARAENKRLREALAECADCAEEGWAYASPYFREKWGAVAWMAQARAALARSSSGGGR